MTQAWVVLTRPDGRDVAAPTAAQLAATLAELYSGKAASPDGGPGSAVLRFGYDDGLMYEVEVASGGEIRYEEWWTAIAKSRWPARARCRRWPRPTRCNYGPGWRSAKI